MIGLDPHAIKELKKVFEELRDSGCMVLVSTHMIDSMEELWDTTYIMKQGRVAAVVERENLKDNNKSLEDIFFEITEGAALGERGVGDAVMGLLCMAYLLEHDKKDVSKYISRDHSCHFWIWNHIWTDCWRGRFHGSKSNSRWKPWNRLRRRIAYRKKQRKRKKRKKRHRRLPQSKPMWKPE